MGKMNNAKVYRPKNAEEMRQTVAQLSHEGYRLMLPKYEKGSKADTPTWEMMVNSVGIGGKTGKDGNFVSVSAKEMPVNGNIGTKGLGWMSWGDDNKLPNTVAALTGMLPYTATGWKFNTDVTAGLGPRPKYRYTEYTPGIGVSTKEIDYDAAGPMILQRIKDLRKEYLSVKGNQMELDEVAKQMLSDIQEDVKRLKSEYEKWEKTNQEVKLFMKNTSLDTLLLKMASEFHFTGMCFPELQLTSDLTTDTNVWTPKVGGLGMYSCWITRLERRDKNGKINYVYLNNAWLEGKKAEEKDLVTLPALDPDAPYKDLNEKILSIRLEGKMKPENRPTRFVLPVSYPSPGKAYYTQPSWHSIFGGSIYEYASTIISDRATRRKNSNIIGRVIYIHNDYLKQLYQQYNAGTQEEMNKLFGQVTKEINEFLRDPENSGQSLFAYSFTGYDGKEHDSYRIVEIPASNKATADANKTELEEVCNIIFFAMGIQPALIGAVPGHSGSSGGTYQREMLMIKQLLQSPTQRLLLKPFEVASAINGWDDHLVWRVQQMVLTTLDASKSGMKEAETD